MNTGAPFPEPKVAEERVLHFQRKLHEWASNDDQRRFHDLWNLVCDPATLVVAWSRVSRNRGSRTAGVDAATRRHVEARGVDQFLSELREELRAETFRPLPVRERMIPKRDGRKRRLGIPTLKDRVVQMALKLVMEPIFGKRRTTGMREGNGRVLHRRPSESRWPRPCVGDPRGRSEALDRGARRPAIEPRHGSYLGVPTRSKTSEGNTAGGVIASRPRAPRGLRTRACVRALHAENREISRSPACRDGGAGRAGKAEAVIP